VSGDPYGENINREMETMRLGEHGKEIWGSEDTYVYSNNSG